MQILPLFLLGVILAVSIGLAVYTIFNVYCAFYVAPYVASGSKAIKNMLDLANVKPGMRVLELGSGLGVLCIQAVRRGAVANGIELNPVLVALARLKAKKHGVSKSVEFIRGDFLRRPFPKETETVFLYLMPQIMTQLWEKLKKELPPGTIVISHAFKFLDQKPEAQLDNVYRYRL